MCIGGLELQRKALKADFMTEQSTRIPFHSASPKVGIILLWYPLFTQPFIFRDVEAIKTRLPAIVYTLYGENLRLCSREMCQAGSSAQRLGIKKLLPILFSNAKFLLGHPLRYTQLFGNHVMRRWKSFEILGENLWAFLCGIHLAPIVLRAGIEILYAPWPRGTTTAARVIFHCTGIPYVTVARADNLEPRDPDLVDKLLDACAIRTNNCADGMRIEKLLAEGLSHNTGQDTPEVRVIYNCLTLHVNKCAPLAMKKPVKLLAVGRFDVTKGFDVLLDACAILLDQHVSFTLSLVGGGGKLMGLGNLEERLHRQTRELGLEKIVSFPGLVDHDAFPDILRSHDIFVAPCVIASGGARDGIPNTLIEAMSFGLPVVATNVSALPEIVRHEHTGLLVPQRNPAALAQALRTLIENPEKARTLALNGAKLARELFSPQKNGELLADFLVQANRAWRSRKCAE